MRRRCGMHAGQLLLVMLMTALSALPAAARAEPDPQDARTMVNDVTQKMLSVLDSDQAQGDDGASFVRKKVKAVVAPHLDFVTMTKLAIGPHWQDASDDQKRTLVNQFRSLLLRTYSSSLTEYSDQKLKFLPVKPGENPNRVKVRSMLIQADGPKVPVNYRARYHDGDWQVYDIVVDGVSLVTNYRSTFSSRIRDDGVAGLIETLEKKNNANATLDKSDS